MNLQALTDTGASDDERRAVRAALARAGFEAQVEAIIPPQGEGTYWIVLLAIPPAAFLQALFSEAGKDAWKGLKRLLTDIRAARGEGAGQGDIVVRPDRPTPEDTHPSHRAALLLGWVDPDQATSLNLSPDLPEEALRALFELDLEEAAGKHLYWDPELRRWRH